MIISAQGINFESGPWIEVVKKAKEQDKLIYLDAFAVWCGPCKMMEKNIFPTQEAGEKYNSLFINYKVDAEKGEGIEIARKYNVTAYPSNFYINPHDESVVYEAVGGTDLSGFLARADLAIAEYNDSLSWKDYQNKLQEMGNDQEFIAQYIEKAKRTGNFADPALDKFIDNINGQLTEKHIIFLIENTQTFDNKVVDYLFENKNQVNQLYAEQNLNFFGAWIQQLPYYTFQKAIKTQNEQLIDLIYDNVQKYGFPKDILGKYGYLRMYYQQTGNSEKSDEIGKELSDYLVDLPSSKYEEVNEEAKQMIITQIINQLENNQVPDSSHALIIENTLKENPQYTHTANLTAAQNLNQNAWVVVEDKNRGKKDLKRALTWSEKALVLTEGLNEWPLFGDTYAHLLYISGKKKAAIDMQERVVEKAKSSDIENIEELQETLDKMKSGTLDFE